jgi:ParB family chromosome partitioning protein
MARKGVFINTMKEAIRESEAKPESEAPALQVQDAADDGPKQPRRTSPNVKIFQETFEDQLSRTLQDVDTALIDASRLKDRLDVSDDLEELKSSIKESGQKVPVLLRRIQDGRYEVVYGRRRILACRSLGIPVRAMVSDLDDEEALIAQGLENSARLNNSFIERCLFVHSILKADYDIEIVRKALGINRDDIIRLDRIVRSIPIEIIQAIGPAHKVGRRPWTQVARIFDEEKLPDTSKLLELVGTSDDSSKRFRDFVGQLEKLIATPQQTADTDQPFQVVRKRNSLKIEASKDVPVEFLIHIQETLDTLYERWSNGG